MYQIIYMLCLYACKLHHKLQKGKEFSMFYFCISYYLE